MAEPETIDISLGDSSFNIGSSKSSNFGGGLELLMNDRVKDGGGGGGGGDGFDIGDINDLEADLQDLETFH